MAKPITSRSRGDTFLLLILPLAFIAILAALLSGCGGKRETAQLPVIAANAQEDSASAISEVLAAPVPEGVEPALWTMLRNELAREMGEKEVSQPKSLNITWTAWTDGVGWRNDFMKADGNDDGVINIADLTLIVMHFGSTEEYSKVYSADYNGDGRVDIRDITPLAHSYGLSCSEFIVELSSTGADTGFSSAPKVDYSDYVSKYQQFHTYRVICYPWLEPRLFVRVRALDGNGIEIGRSTFDVPVGGISPCWGPEPAIASSQPPIVTWSNDHMLPDGNQDGVTDWFDLGYLFEYFGTLVSERPNFQVADYNWDGQVGVSDLPMVAARLHLSIAEFIIEVSTTSADEGYVANGTLDFLASTGFNEGGFRYYEYEIVSPPVVPFWVRVVTVGKNGETGNPHDPVYFAP
jgi:hypothetical protein